MFHQHPAFPLLLATGLATAAVAQSGSPVVAIGHGFSVDPATTIPGATAKSVLMTSSNFDGAPPSPPAPYPGAPDFGLLPFPAGIDIDALSLGFDWVLATPAGVVDVPPGHWGAITFSVRRTTVGAPGSVIAQQAVLPDGAAADIFAYVLPGSALPTPPTGVPFRAQDSTEINANYGPGNINAHDVFIGLIYRDNPQIAAILPPPTVFFSVTDATKALIPLGAPPIGWTAVPAERSGATVFMTTWNTVSLSWGPVSVALPPTALGLASTEDLDALALDLVHGRVLLSTNPSLPPPPPLGGRNPILYSNMFSGSNVPYTLIGGTPVSAAVGLGTGPDDIDAICALDPGNPALPSQIRLDFMLGSPGNQVFPAPTQLQTGVYRHLVQPVNQERFVTYMTGWPPPGNPQPGFAVVALSLGGAAGPWTTGGLFLRPNAASPYFPFQGHPEKYEFHIPPAYSLSGFPLTFIWGAFSAATFDLSLPVTIRL